MTNNIISFGEHKGRSFEWLMFNAPWYADWMNRKGVLWKREDYDEEDCEYFDELFNRASFLGGQCRYCNERKITRMQLGRLIGTTGQGHVTFMCEKCDDGYQDLSLMVPPSMITEKHKAPRCAQITVNRCVAARYMGPGSITQWKMEAFFREDDHFKYSTPGFFIGKEAFRL